MSQPRPISELVHPHPQLSDLLRDAPKVCTLTEARRYIAQLCDWARLLDERAYRAEQPAV